LSETTHNVYAKVTDAAGNVSAASANLSVTVDLTGPSGIPQILTPFQGQNTGTDKTPTFRWLAVSGADYHDFQVDDSSGFSGPEIDQSWLSATQYTPSTDMPVSGVPVGSRYYLRIRALDIAGNTTAWSSQLRYVNVGRFDKDFNGDGYSDVIIGAYQYDFGGVEDRGQAYIFYGGVSMNGSLDVAMVGEARSDCLGYSVSSAGDVNGDGYCDVIVGTPKKDTSGVDFGKAYVYYGGASMNNGPDVTMAGEAAYDYFGTSVSSAGDVNGDGYCDVIVGAPYNDVGGTDSGEAYIFYGGSSMNNIPDVTMPGEWANDQFGWSVD
jgi:hypothetical protein